MTDQYKRKFDVQKPNFRGISDMQQLAQSMESYVSRMIDGLRSEFTSIERTASGSASSTTTVISSSSGGGGGGSSSPVTDYFRSGSQVLVVTGMPIPVNFSSSLGVAPSVFVWRCYAADGSTVGADITTPTATGFTISPMENSTVEYVAIKAI